MGAGSRLRGGTDEAFHPILSCCVLRALPGGVVATADDTLLLPAKPSAGPRKFRDANECPMRKLTVNLLATYKEINAVCGAWRARPRPALILSPLCRCTTARKRSASCRRRRNSRANPSPREWKFGTPSRPRPALPVRHPVVRAPHSNAYDYVVKVGDLLGSRYRVLESLGKVGHHFELADRPPVGCSCIRRRVRVF